MGYITKPEFAAGNETPEARKWLREQFQFNNCEECGRGALGHVVVHGAIGAFAICKPTSKTRELSPMQQRVFERKS